MQTPIKYKTIKSEKWIQSVESITVTTTNPSFFAYFKIPETQATCAAGCQLLCISKRILCTFLCILSLIRCIHRAWVSTGEKLRRPDVRVESQPLIYGICDNTVSLCLAVECVVEAVWMNERHHDQHNELTPPDESVTAQGKTNEKRMSENNGELTRDCINSTTTRHTASYVTTVVVIYYCIHTAGDWYASN